MKQIITETYFVSNWIFNLELQSTHTIPGVSVLLSLYNCNVYCFDKHVDDVSTQRDICLSKID